MVVTKLRRREFFVVSGASMVGACVRAEPIPLERRFNSSLFGATLDEGPAGECSVTKRASVPVAVRGLVHVDARINGAAADLVLDTGAERSVLGVDAAKRLRVTTEYDFSRSMRGIGSVFRTGDA